MSESDPVSPGEGDARQAWYRAQAGDFGDNALFWVRGTLSVEDDVSAYDHARLAAHFGLLALRPTAQWRAQKHLNWFHCYRAVCGEAEALRRAHRVAQRTMQARNERRQAQLKALGVVSVDALCEEVSTLRAKLAVLGDRSEGPGEAPPVTEPEEVCSDFQPGGSVVAPQVYCRRCGYRKEDHATPRPAADARLRELIDETLETLQMIASKWTAERGGHLQSHHEWRRELRADLVLAMKELGELRAALAAAPQEQP